MLKLFLASEGTNPITIKELEKYCQGFRDKNLTYIPTAGNGYGYNSWRVWPAWQEVQALGCRTQLLILEEKFQEDFSKILAGQDIIWFGGGTAGYLMYWINRCRLQAVLRQRLAQGAIYVGSSAGAMITGPTLDVSDWYPGDEEPGAKYLPGLGLVDFDIFPHFQEQHLAVIKEKYHGQKMYLLQDGEAMIVDNGLVTVLGQTRVVP